MLINGRQISPVQGGVTVRQAGHGPAAGTIIIQRGKTNKRDKE
jgi:hypothetical protein